MNNKPKNNPPIQETQEIIDPLDFPNPKLKEKYNSEKQNIEVKTEKKLTLNTYAQIGAILLSENEMKAEKGLKTYDKILQENGIEWELDDLLDNYDLRKEALTNLKNKQNKKKSEKILINQLETYEIYYQKGLKSGIDMTDSLVISQIWDEQESFGEEYTKSYKKWEKENPNKAKKESGEAEEIESNKQSNTVNKKIEINTQNYNYNPENNIIYLNNSKILKDIKPSIEDKKMLNKNNIDYYIQIHETFKELGLSRLIPYLSEISNIVGNNGNSINYNEDFLNQVELQKILNYILKSLGKTEIKIVKDIKEYKNIYIKLFSNMGEFKNDLNKIGNSSIEEQFFKKFINNGDFDEIKFINNIKKKS